MNPGVEETIAARLTPPGAGAIATVAVRGPHAGALIRALSRPRGKSEWPPDGPGDGRFWLGRFGPSAGAADDVVLVQKRSEPVPWFEIHCHGGVAAVGWILNLLREAGAGIVPWEEFEQRTPAAIGRAATVALTEAATVRAAAVLLDQEQGALHRAVDAISRALEQGESARAERLLQDVLRHAPVGQHLTTPWRVVVAGAPNVGKSSLVNALAGFQRSVVAPTPGTTRDVVTVRLAIDGWTVELADTAGIRAGADALEDEGVARARAAARAADLCLWVLDASASPAWPPDFGVPAKLVINKIDLPAAWDPPIREAVRVSARTGEGVPELCARLGRWLVPDPPAPGAAVPFTAALAERLRNAAELIRDQRVADARRVFLGLTGSGSG